MKLGFIGQGWIGKHLADYYEGEGFDIVRFSKEKKHIKNKNGIADCDIVFIAVPTPTTPSGFDASILEGVIPLVGVGKVAVIKSTILPGTTDALQEKYPDRIILHSPEFLREKSVFEDIHYPQRNIIGIPASKMKNQRYKKAAARALRTMPRAPYSNICTAIEAELTKYAGNAFLYTKVVFVNLMYDLAEAHGADWDVVAENMKADPRIGPSHMHPVHQYDHLEKKKGRGAGGHCLIKDFAALREYYAQELPKDTESIRVLEALESKNNQLLIDSGKDRELLKGVYGKNLKSWRKKRKNK